MQPMLTCASQQPARIIITHPAPDVQVDRDLRAFKADANSMLNRLKVHGVSQGDTSLAEEQEQLIMRVVDIADECLECTIDDFKLTVTDIVDSIEVGMCCWHAYLCWLAGGYQ